MHIFRSPGYLAAMKLLIFFNDFYELIASQEKSNDKYTGQCIIHKQTENAHVTRNKCTKFKTA